MAKDEHVLIKWKDVDDWEDFEDIGGSDLFALVRGSRVIYVGAFRSDEVIREVEEVLERIGESKENIQLWAGDIEFYPSSLAGDRDRLVREVVCALAFSLMPPHNTHCIDRYEGREGFIIRNRGCPYIKGRVKAGLR